ncbi:UNVERIFIED_ORG: O-antigen/teichoic acid export membrane protein [Peribacillus simplex]
MININSMTIKVIAVFMGSSIFMVSQFLIIIILARLGNAEIVGEFGLVLAITGPVYMFFTFQIRNAITSENSSVKLSDYAGVVVLNSLLATITSLVICLITKTDLSVTYLVVIYLFAKNIQLVSELIYGYFQHKEDLHVVGLSNFMKGILSALLFFVFYYFGNNILLATFSIGLSWLLVLLFYDIPKMHIGRNYRSILIKVFLPNKIMSISSLYKLLIPLGLISLLYSLNTNISRYFITYYMDTEMLGYFTACSYLMIAGNTFVGAIGQSFCNRLARYNNQQTKDNFKNLFYKLVIFGISLGLISTFLSFIFGKVILSTLFGSEYIKYSSLLTLLMVATIFRYPSEFMGYATIATKTYKNELPQLIFMLIVTVICSFIFVSKFGLYGSALTLIVGSLITALGRFSIIYGAYRLKERKANYEL